MWNQFQFKKLIQKHWLHDAKWSKMPTIKSGWSIKTPIKRSPVHCYFCTLHRMCPYYLYRYSNVLKLAPMLEGLLLEVMCKEELKRTITHDFMYISVGLGFFWPTLYIMFTHVKIPINTVLVWYVFSECLMCGVEFL